MNWYLGPIKKYAVFNGRATRMEYWLFIVCNWIVMIVAAGIDYLVLQSTTLNSLYGIVSLLYSLAVFIPTLALLWRRLHDVGKSGWWIFITLIPIVGGIWFFVLLFTDSQRGENKYGPNPKKSLR
jgi:uncharacterized membrane protein YhaH (DUF805 family)